MTAAFLKLTSKHAEDCPAIGWEEASDPASGPVLLHVRQTSDKMQEAAREAAIACGYPIRCRRADGALVILLS